MPRYHFNVRGSGRDVDEDGTELNDPQQAGTQAVLLIGEILREWPEDLWKDRDLQVEVTDQEGAWLFAVTASVMLAPAIWKRQ